MASDSDSLSSSSSSDDEFLTIGGGGTGANAQDREALIRKKLLESFYGKSALQEGKSNDSSSSSSDESDDQKLRAVDSMDDSETREKSTVKKGNDDLDSPYFDAEAHTSRHVAGSTVHTLLETEEQLALEVRTLDSTMQTLVYENYSKFIDATDAIRSIGVSVNANEQGLARLSRGMQTIDDETRSVEESLSSLRDAVAEKIRVKRLLTRLDTLLKLPTTLKQHVANGKYRLAAKSYLSASSILSKHSSGFESLKSIETECHVILTDMVSVLKRKLLYWSGRRDALMEDEEGMDVLDGEEADNRETEPSGWVPPPEPPQTVSEIFECAGTLVMVLPNEEVSADASRVSFESGLSADDCKSMALSSSVRLLDRILDSHHIEMQEAKFATPRPADTSFEANLGGMAPAHEGELKETSRGNHLIPTSYLDSVLEAATLYGMSFSTAGGLDVDDRERIVEFVSEAFGSFLGHVREVLLELSPMDESDEHVDETEETGDQEDVDGAYSEISTAMTHLLRSVRDLASGLALPEVGVDVEVASSLVDQTVEVTEAMVRRSVAQKFFSLRVRVLKDCLGPFAKEAVALPAESEGSSTARVVDVVQMASVALSDGMQLVDDVVRSILSGGVMVGSSGTSVDSAMVKQAVLISARRFAAWLASILEVLAGCENSDPKLIVDATDTVVDEEEDDSFVEEDESTKRTSRFGDFNDVSDRSGAASEKVDAALAEVLAELEEEATVTAHSDLTLAIAEMCRLAERNVMENINQSMSSTDGGGKKSKSTGIFASAGPSQSKKGSYDEDSIVSERFRLAASRVLAFYAVSRGNEAASILCGGLYPLSCSEKERLPDAPRSAAWQVLEIAKLTSIDCANVFGGEKRGGPVPALSGDDVSSSPLRRNITGSSYGGGPMSSLQLDVERMFTEKVATYPHPSRVMDFSRNNVVTVMFKVAFKAMMEIARTCTFTTFAYRQLQVDVELLRCFVPHYVNEDYLSEGTNACNILYNLLDDVMMNAGERCQDLDCVGAEEYYDAELETSRTPRSIVRDFLAPDEEEEGDGITSRFTIAED